MAGIATVLMVLYAQFVLGHFSQGFYVKDGLNSLGLSFSYGQDEVAAFLYSRNVSQLWLYIDFLKVWDTIFPVVYTLMYVLWIVYLFEKRKIIILLPINRMVADWVENFFEISLVENYINTLSIDSTMVSQASTFTSIKWILSWLVYAIFLIGIFNLFKAKFKKDKGPKN